MATIFTLLNSCKTRSKTVLKLINFACVLRQLVETSLKNRAKNIVSVSNFHFANACNTRAKTVFKSMQFACVFRYFVKTNVVFVSNFHFGKCVQNTGKTVLKWIDFACVFRHFVETSFKKCAKRSVFFSFNFGKCVKNTSKNLLEMNAISKRFETLCGHKFESNVLKKEFLWALFFLFFGG